MAPDRRQVRHLRAGDVPPDLTWSDATNAALEYSSSGERRAPGAVVPIRKAVAPKTAEVGSDPPKG